MSVLEKLTEGIVKRDVYKEGAALFEKWEKTGLLEGLNNDHSKNTMARLLENQAAQLLKEASTMSGGDVEGFAAVAFPIVRRVFGGLIANDLVSVQPMSLPSGLIFFMDFQYTDSGQGGQPAHVAEQSLYGGGVVARQLTGGVDLTGLNAEKGFYSLNQGYSSATGSFQAKLSPFTIVGSGTVGSNVNADAANGITEAATAGGGTTSLSKLVNYDPDLSGSKVVVVDADLSTVLSAGDLSNLSRNNLITLNFTASALEFPFKPTLATSIGAPANHVNSASFRLIRRHTSMYNDLVAKPLQRGAQAVNNPADSSTHLRFVFEYLGEDPSFAVLATGLTGTQAPTITFAVNDALTQGNGLGSVVGTTPWALEGAGGKKGGGENVGNTGVAVDIPEIDIKVDSIAVTARTKKLKAKWTPELGQDLNAYHNLDAEVELTSILSEQIALEIDREILNDLVEGATAVTYDWSRSPGMFLMRDTGQEIGQASAAPDFTGTVSEWYETLIETINDVSAQIHRKTLRGGANFVVTSPEVANILEFTSGFRASVTADADKGSIGAVKVGNLSKKWDVLVDPYFPRNLVLVGRKGGSFLESGYVYAPYVPLQVTPTIFGTEDFVPRKGVMTRYAKKMVRPDMYGLVVVRGLLGEAGATA